MDALARLAADVSRGDELDLHPEQMAANFLSFLEQSDQWFLLIEDITLPFSLSAAAAAKHAVVSEYLGSVSPANQAVVAEQPTPDSPNEQSTSLQRSTDDVYFNLLHCIWTLGGGRVICTSRLRPANNELLRKSDHCLSLDDRLLTEEPLLQIFKHRVHLWSGTPLNQVGNIRIIIFLIQQIN